VSQLSRAERARLPSADFAEPDRRLLPVLDQEDVGVALRLARRMRDPEAVALRVVELARRRGLEVPVQLELWAWMKRGRAGAGP
jgi:hypothetical protein